MKYQVIECDLCQKEIKPTELYKPSMILQASEDTYKFLVSKSYVDVHIDCINLIDKNILSALQVSIETLRANQR